jgi:hypothetical protein
VSFIDDFSKFTWIYLLQHKSEVFQRFHEFQNLVEHLFNRKIVAMQTDWGGIRNSTPFSSALVSHTMSLAPILTNKMAPLNENIDTLLR